MSDSFAPARQRPAPTPDRLSTALSSRQNAPIACHLTLKEALAESRTALEEADRGDLAPWQLGRAIDLATQFPHSEGLQIAVGRLTRLLGGLPEASSCWREMAARFPDSTRILELYAGALQELHGTEIARSIIDRYIGDPSLIEDPKAALRSARALYRLGDRDAAIALLSRIDPAKRRQDVALQLARWLEEAGRFAAAEELLENLPRTPRTDRARQQLAARKRAIGPGSTSETGSVSAGIHAMERLIDLALEMRDPPARRPSARLGAIGIIGSTLGSGGAERQLATTALGLAATPGQRVAGPLTVYCRKLDARRGNDFYLPSLEKAGIRVVDYRRAPNFGGDPQSSLLAAHRDLVALLPPHMREGVRKLTDLLRHDAPDVVQIWQDGTIFASGLAALLAGIPRILLNVRTMPPTERIDRMRPEQASLYRGLLRGPGVTLTTNSHIAARAYEQWLDLARGSVSVIPNGVEPLPADADPLETSRWQRFDRATGTGFVLGGVMRFDNNKRPLEWLAIAAGLAAARPEARFVLVGDGPMRAAAEAFARRKGMADRTLFVGRSAAVGFWLDRFDALALTSRHEGTPNVLIEAQLAGLPVLSTPAGGAADAVAPLDANCILDNAERPDRAAAVAHLAGLADRVADRVESDAAAIRRWAGRFSVEGMIGRTLELFGAPL